jgi:hypothetical protein
LLLILIGCNIWLIKRELKLKLFGNSFYNYKSSGSLPFLGGGNSKPERQPPKDSSIKEDEVVKDGDDDDGKEEG